MDWIDKLYWRFLNWFKQQCAESDDNCRVLWDEAHKEQQKLRKH